MYCSSAVRSTLPFSTAIHNPLGHLSESFDGIGNIGVSQRDIPFTVSNAGTCPVSTRRTYTLTYNVYALYRITRRVTLKHPVDIHIYYTCPYHSCTQRAKGAWPGDERPKSDAIAESGEGC
jgi:hypothetical protein